KILVCGSPRSGKSALVARYATGLSPDPFLSAYLQTLGAELVIKHVVEGENRLSLHLWSVGGHPRYRSTVTPLLTDDTAAVLVTVDLLSASSLEDAAVWVALAKEHCPTAIVYLIGTKADETDKITVSMPELAKVARDAGATAPLKTTSARTGAGVTDLFADL
ncbi:P-loop containing nucleoside triphosphate hydrolase protein, partial [Blastocladiella britannica]